MSPISVVITIRWTAHAVSTFRTTSPDVYSVYISSLCGLVITMKNESRFFILSTVSNLLVNV